MLVKMICKNIDRKNMLLYALSMILSIVLDTFFLTALIVNDQYGLGEKPETWTGSARYFSCSRV